MKWTTRKPKKAGLYLRNNPPIQHISRAMIYEIDDNLFLSSTDGSMGSKLLSKVCPAFMWYGPIPPITEEMQKKALLKRKG